MSWPAGSMSWSPSTVAGDREGAARAWGRPAAALPVRPGPGQRAQRSACGRQLPRRPGAGRAGSRCPTQRRASRAPHPGRDGAPPAIPPWSGQGRPSGGPTWSWAPRHQASRAAPDGWEIPELLDSVTVVNLPEPSSAEAASAEAASRLAGSTLSSPSAARPPIWPRRWPASPRRSTPRARCGSRGPGARPGTRATSPRTSSASSRSHAASSIPRSPLSTPTGPASSSSGAMNGADPRLLATFV